MATLTGQSIASSYEQLLHTDTDGGGNGATLVPIKDGDNGTTFSLELATTSIAIGATHKLYLDGGGNTYITESSADTIELATGGTTRMIIDGTGIGLGGSPDSKLHIKGASNNDAKITLTNTNPDPDNIWSIHANYNTQELKINGDSNTVLTLLDTGTATFSGDVVTTSSVGIGSGATTPSHPLHVATGNDNGLIAEFQNTEDTDDRCFGVRIKAGSTSTDYALQVQDHDASNTLFRVSGNGNTGIGINSPARLLHVSGAGSGNPLAVVEDTSGNSNLLIKATASNKNSILLFGDNDSDEVGRIDYEHNGDEMHFYTGSATRLKLDSNSRISLGNNDSSGTVRNTIFGHQTGNVIASGALENTLFGYQAGLAISTGDYNTALGCLALQDEELGQGAVAIGGSALFSQNTGSQSLSHNVAVGLNTSYYNVTGINNTAVGALAMLGASGNSHSNNTAIGYAALLSTTTANSNVAIGSMAGKDITEGHENVFIGQSAGENATTHADNVMIGFEAGKNLQQGKCVAIGHKAYLNGGGDSNLAIGYQTMGSGSVSGYSNQAIGRQAMENLAGGQKNIAIGEQALQENQNGHEQIAIGNTALRDCNGGVQNIAIGFQSQQTHDGGNYNTSVGYKTLKDDTGNGNDNTAIGAGVLENFIADTNAHGQNTAIGSYAGNDVTSGTSNTLIGKASGHTSTNNLTTGDDNTLVGADTAVSAVGAINQTVLGKGATGQGNNTVTLGNGDVAKVYMSQDGDAVMYANATIQTSDKRLKENINDCDLGLSFINALNPVSYKFKDDKQPEKLKYGIIAQEVQEVLKESGNDDFAGITDKGDYLGADYVQFIAPLIKAIQELSAKVKELEEKK